MIKPFAAMGVMLAAMPVFAQGPANAALGRLDEFVAVFQAQNCTLATKGENAISEEALFALFAQAGFVESDVPVYAMSLVESGRATVEEASDSVTILPPLCIVEGSK